MNRSIRLAAALLALSVALGAFGAHALADHVTPERLQTWRTADRMLAVHAAALLALAAWGGAPRGAFRLLVAGVLLFSGSLFLLVALDLPALGAVTPLGGAALIAGWTWVAIKA